MTNQISAPAGRRSFGLFGSLILGAFALIYGQTAAAAPPASEKLLYNWTTPITTKDRGFPRFYAVPYAKTTHPSTTIQLLKAPLNFAEGTLYIQVTIKDQPKAKSIKWQYCAWQVGDPSVFPLRPKLFPEVCTRRQPLMNSGPGTRTISWYEPITGMWKKPYVKGGPGIPMNWAKPRSAHGFAIMLPTGVNITNYSGFKRVWGGENPNEWYPMNTTGGSLKVVVVAKGYTFSGWQNYP